MEVGVRHESRRELEELAAAYAIDAMDAVERQAYDAHIPTCPDCQQAVDEMCEAALMLALSVEQADPPARVKSGMLRMVQAAQTRSARRRSPLQGMRSSLRSHFLGGRTLALASGFAIVLLLIAAAGALAWQQSQMSELRDQLATQQSMVAQQKTRLDQQDATLATQATQIERQATTMRTLTSQVRTKQAVDKLVSSPGAAVATLDSGRVTAHLVSAPNNAKAYLVVNGLPRLAAGRDYQVWLMRDQKPVSVGVFHPMGNGRWVLNAPAPLKAFSWIGITDEPRGGSPAPTTKPLLGTDLQ